MFGFVQFKVEIGRVLRDKKMVATMAEEYKLKWQTKILQLAKSKSVVKDILSQAQEQIMMEPDKKQGQYFSLIY